ncbi:MAG: hypothetical protein AB8H47_17005 [Bacteroidia bacterium]
MKTNLWGVLKSVYWGLMVGLALLLIAYFRGGIVWVLLGGLIISFSVYVGLDNLKREKKLQEWQAEHEGKRLFFFPTKQKIQRRIMTDVLPLFEKKIQLAYYDGPKIVSDLDGFPHHLKYVFKRNPEIVPNSPSIIRIDKNELSIIAKLPELMQIENQDFDIQVIRNRILALGI